MDMILCTMVTMTLNIYGYDTVYYGYHDPEHVYRRW